MAQFNGSKLRGRIIEKYGSINNFSSSIKKNRSSISLMLNGKTSMNWKDIVLFSTALGIDRCDIGDYFFS